MSNTTSENQNTTSIPTDYILVCGNLSTLEQRVKEYLIKGYIPLGSPQVDNLNEGSLIQAMITYKVSKSVFDRDYNSWNN